MDDTWLYWEVTHHLHTFCNPISGRAVEELGDLLGLGPDVCVLDIACGHGEMLARWSERHGCRAVGVDLSPYVIERARARTQQVEFVLADGADYAPGERFDVVSCIGASWIWGGFRGTLEAMRDRAKPGGLLACGEPYWRTVPYTRDGEPGEPAQADHEQPYFSMHECHVIARDLGLTTLWMRAATTDEWDRYEMLQATAVDRWARAHPDHPDVAAIRAQHERSRDDYLRWGRDAFGFAVWIFRT